MELVKRQSSTAPSLSGLLDEFFLKELNPIGGRLMAKTAPSVNIYETPEKFILEVAAPGMTKSDFNVEVTPQNQLIISSENKREDERQSDDGRRFTMKEFSYSSFKRTFNLPDSVNTEEIKATYKDGLLEVALQKKPEALPKPSRTIEIG
jgi:HSP20 family protein